MLRNPLLTPLTAGLAAMLLCGAAEGFNPNKSVDIEPGTESDGRSTVNGSITVGRDAVVNGDLETVNGSIRVEENARVGGLQTVNGRIRVAPGVTAGGLESVNGAIRLEREASVEGVEVVNGRIEVERGVRIARDVENVNGEIRIAGAEIGGDLETVNGDVSLTEGTHLAGDLTVERPQQWFGNRRKPRIVIGPGVRVDGVIMLEREVELFISETAEVGDVRGEMTLADAVRFAGDTP